MFSEKQYILKLFAKLFSEYGLVLDIASAINFDDIEHEFFLENCNETNIATDKEMYHLKKTLDIYKEIFINSRYLDKEINSFCNNYLPKVFKQKADSIFNVFEVFLNNKVHTRAFYDYIYLIGPIDQNYLLQYYDDVIKRNKEELFSLSMKYDKDRLAMLRQIYSIIIHMLFFEISVDDTSAMSEIYTNAKYKNLNNKNFKEGYNYALKEIKGLMMQTIINVFNINVIEESKSVSFDFRNLNEEVLFGTSRQEEKHIAVLELVKHLKILHLVAYQTRTQNINEQKNQEATFQKGRMHAFYHILQKSFVPSILILEEENTKYPDFIKQFYVHNIINYKTISLQEDKKTILHSFEESLEIDILEGGTDARFIIKLDWDIK